MLGHQPCAVFRLAALGLLVGCAHTVESAPPTAPPRAAVGAARAHDAVATAEDTRTRVYVVNGVDPLHVAGLNQLADRIRSSGYPHTRYGPVYDISDFEREIRKVYAGDPSAAVRAGRIQLPARWPCARRPTGSFTTASRW